MIEILGTNEFAAWFRALGDAHAKAVARKVDLLEAVGVGLGYPHSSSLKGSEFPLRELRAQSGGRPLRVFYAFDPSRRAVLLIGGDKTGDGRFYERWIPLAERLWRHYLAEVDEVEKEGP